MAGTEGEKGAGGKGRRKGGTLVENRTYVAIDLKSFYASVECVRRGLDPLTTNLVVADAARTEKTICLAVSPSLKSYGIAGRARLFEVIEKVREINVGRQKLAPGRAFTGKSSSDRALRENPSLALDYIVAPPRMAHYMEVSTEIYQIYLKYIAPEDIHVYSIDEVMMDVTAYLPVYGVSARELAMRMILDVLGTTGITATAGIGTNLYLCKVAMDIQAKHIPPDKNGVRIAELDEMSYRRALWGHRPLTDFWRVGHGIAKKLESVGLRTMGDVARCSLGGPDDYYNEALLYRLFGVNAELLIDHAWGWEPCTMPYIKAYRPRESSSGAGQVLDRPYPFAKARLVAQEMADQLALDLVQKRLVTDRITLTVGYDVENLKDPARRARYRGAVTNDHYGRPVPKHAHGTEALAAPTSSSKAIVRAALALFDRAVNRELLVRRMYIVANHVQSEAEAAQRPPVCQLSLFVDYGAERRRAREEAERRERERKLQETMLRIKEQYGKNAILKGMNLLEGATAAERNGRIGGHKA